MSEVTVYTKKVCGPCQGVKATLRRHKIIFTEVSIEEDAEARQYLLDNNVMSTPVLRVGQTLVRSPEEIIMWAKKHSRRDEG